MAYCSNVGSHCAGTPGLAILPPEEAEDCNVGEHTVSDAIPPSVYLNGSLDAVITKIDPDRRPDPRASAWYFRDEVLRMLFHAHSLSLFRKTFSSHFSETSILAIQSR